MIFIFRCVFLSKMIHFFPPTWYLFVERYLSDAEAADDVVQECFIRLWQQRGEFEYLYQVKSFLYTSARNSALNELEHKKVVSSYASKLLEKKEDVFFRDQVIEEETYRILVSAIGKLPEQTRKVMLLALEGKKIAYKRLREELKEYFYLLLALVG